MRASPLRLLAVVVALLALAVPAAAASSPGTRRLQRALRAQLRQAGRYSSALVVDATTGRTLFAQAPNTPRLPASVEKLYTTTAALLKLGPAARFATTVYGVGAADAAGIWHGTLYLRGGGDPTFGGAAFDRAAYTTGATVQQLVGNLRRAGIRGVAGRIVGDESLFDSLRGTVATHFRPDLEYEGELSALAFDAGFTSADENALQPRPALFAAQQFAAALRAARLKLAKHIAVYTGPTPPGARLLAKVSSPTLSTLVALTNSPSDNFFAEMLLKELGARFSGAGTTAAGAAVVRSVIAQRFALTPTLDDGSGLSRDDRTTATQVVALLRDMQDDQAFQDSLAVAGERGTMRHEMVGTRAAGNCRGKTGTLRDVANLVGYCTAANGDELVFAFLENGLGNTYIGHLLEDHMGEALAAYAG
jgi:D-alanyl-D-alanine carboxypeptidase/D-alanyl-D-alanine-endopeptidase (penicillin-binding protein 4)